MRLLQLFCRGFVSLSLATAGLAALAADEPKVEAGPATDRTNYLSDRVKFSFAMNVKRVDMTLASPTAADACAPAFTTFKGIGVLKVGSTESPAFVVTFVPDEAVAVKAEPARRERCTVTDKRVALDDIVLIPAAQITSTPPDRYGLTYGSLLVPYKYQLKGDKSFGSKATVGAYLGFRQDKSGITGLALQYVGFIGAATVPVAQMVDGQSQTQQLSGVSYGLGLLGTVKGTFEMGLVLGADRVSKNAGYVNNGKPWIAVSLGFSFSG